MQVSISRPIGVYQSQVPDNASSHVVRTGATHSNNTNTAETLGFVGRVKQIANSLDEFKTVSYQTNTPKKKAAPLSNKQQAFNPVRENPRFHFQGLEQVQTAPKAKANKNTWHRIESEKTEKREPQYIFAADSAVKGEALREPLEFLSRRGSITKRPINILSGSHGRCQGDNWVNTGGAIKRDSKLIDSGLHDQDQRIKKFGKMGELWNIKNIADRSNVVDMNEMDVETFAKYIANPNAHVVLGFCYGINDEALRYFRDLKPQISYI